jgi:hypothetical protein
MNTERHQIWINALETYECNQLAEGLRQGEGIGPQIESSGSLNGLRPDNPYVKAFDKLVSLGLQGASDEYACRTVDIVLDRQNLMVDPGEKNRLAVLLTWGEIC